MATQTPASQTVPPTAEYVCDHVPDVSQLVTEDDTPVDGVYSEKQMRLFQDPLNSTWKEQNGGRPFVAMTNGAEKRRADKLAAKLRSMGIDPDA